MDQRLRDDSGVVRTVAVEPLIALLLDDETPWIADEHLQDLFRGWLRALVIADTRPGTRSAFACATGSQPRVPQRTVACKPSKRQRLPRAAARSPEEIEEERRFMERHRALFAARSAIRAPGPRAPGDSAARSPTT